MIKITYSSREPPSLTVKGHSGYGKHGTDIVCASVSALFVTLANSVAEFTDDAVRTRCEPGDGFIEWREAASKEGGLLLNSALLGMRDVAEMYPEHVEFTIV